MKKKSILLLAIILLAFFLRLYRVDQIPPGLNRDEAAIGYTAYSIFKTGRDEFGRIFPLSLQSFGDWKLPLYIYAAIPSIVFFGLNEFGVRLPSVVYGVGTILLTYLLVRRILRSSRLALLSALVLAISPWQLFFSRVASEANFAVFLTLLGVLCLSWASTYPFLLLPSGIFLALPLFTYHGSHVFTPLLLIGLAIYFKKQLFQRPWNLIGGLSFLIIAFFAFGQTLFTADKTKISGLLSINDISVVHEQIVQNRIIFPSQLLGKIYNNKLVFLIENIGQNYLKTFSPEFLFISGGGNAQHNIPQFGNLYLIEAPLLLIGIFELFRRKKRIALLFIYWWMISGLGAAITKDAPHSARQFALFPVISIMVAYGIYVLWSTQRLFNRKHALSFIIVIVYGLNLSLFMSRYFILFPYKSYKDWGDIYKQMVIKLRDYEHSPYTEIAIAKPEYSLYIYYLFYNQIDPAYAQKNIVRYPPTDEGFVHVKSLGKLSFRKIDWADDLLKPNRLYIDWVDTIPTGATQSAVLIDDLTIKSLRSRGIDTSLYQQGEIISTELKDSVPFINGTPFFYFIQTIANATKSADLKINAN